MPKNSKKLAFPFYSLTAVIVLASSCAGHYRQSESVADKMKRFESRAKAYNIIPQIPLLKVPGPVLAKGFSTSKKANRAPASVAPTPKESLEVQGLSNKRLYFQALLAQYNELQHYTTVSTASVTQCPHFHSLVLNQGEKSLQEKSVLPLNQYQNLSLTESQPLEAYPELALPLTTEGESPTVWEVATTQEQKSPQDLEKITQQAINIHVSKIYQEIHELCDSGSSDNYYIFENLITHVKTHGPFNPDIKGMEILMRTGLFVNTALIESLSRHRQGSKVVARNLPPATFGEVLGRLEVPWAWNYFSSYH